MTIVQPAVQDPSPGASSTPDELPTGGRFGMQRKLLVMLLVTSIAAAIIVGFVGYRSGTDSLRSSAFDQLTEIRESRSREIELMFETLEDSLVVYTRGRTAIEAVEAFTAGLDDLRTAELTPADDEALDTYYEDVFLPRLVANGLLVDTDLEIPTAPHTRYLQRFYTAPHDTFDDAILVDDAGDGSGWSAAHAQFHDYFRELTFRFGYEDVLLLDTEGDIVYSAYKGVDLGTNVFDGAFAESGLGDAYESAIESNAVDFAAVTDFERYQPSYAVPTAWAVSPIGTDGDISGALAIQLPISTINGIMTGDEGWVDQGLGETGETYLAGPDFLMRSASRLVLEDPAEYETVASDAGLDPELAAYAASVEGTILLQTVETEAVDRALRGETGTLVGTEYLGDESLVAYEPLQYESLPWVVIAKIDTEEAFAPTTDFARRLIISTALIVVVVCIASLLLAQVFVRPVRRIVAGVQAVAGGDLGARVDARSNDEFGDLGLAFNDMSRSLQTKQELLDAQRVENERLLLSLMPANVADRYRQGEETIAEDHQDVAVVSADIVGYNEHTSAMRSNEALALLNSLVRDFDDAADRAGVERVRTLRSGYLAASGLHERHDDNVDRAVAFALELTKIVAAHNARHGTQLGIRAGIDVGAVTSGLVGRSNVVFDLWGEAVRVAADVQSATGEPGIYLSQVARGAVRDRYDAEPLRDTTRSGTWRLTGPSSNSGR